MAIYDPYHGPKAIRMITPARLVLALLLVTLGASLRPQAAEAAPMLVVDAASGQVLFENQAGLPWYPASLTKMMTAYVVLKRAKEGKFSTDSGLTISPQAAKQAPSRMGFKPGTVITLETALRIIMVKSANDVSFAIAENIGGSLEGFTQLMNQDAARLGMTSSHFINPHGLPGRGQRTSARDMAILARALLLEFPQQAYLWRLPAIRYGEHVMRNHNHLIGRYPGSDGMKTGFICSSGFNVVATASRDGQKLITVVMGAPSAKERAEMAARLFENNFGRGGSMTVNEIANRGGDAPDMRDEICRRKGKKGPVLVEDGSAFEVEVARNTGDASSPYAAMMAQRGGARAVNQLAEGGRVSLLQPYQPPGEPVEIVTGGARDMVRPVINVSSVPVMAGAAAIPSPTLQTAPGQIGVPGSPMMLTPSTDQTTRTPGSLYPLKTRTEVKPTLTTAPTPVLRDARPAPKPQPVKTLAHAQTKAKEQAKKTPVDTKKKVAQNKKPTSDKKTATDKKKTGRDGE